MLLFLRKAQLFLYRGQLIYPSHHLLQDASTPGAGKHVIFDSDEEDQRTATSEGWTSKTMLEDETSARTHKVSATLHSS